MKLTDHNGFPRVVITGRGWITPLGRDINKVYDKLLSGQSGITKIDPLWFKEKSKVDFDERRFPSRIAGIIKEDFDEIEIPNINLKKARMARFSKLAAIAISDALKNARLESYLKSNPQDIGTEISSGIGGIEIREENHYKFFTQEKRLSPFMIATDIINMGSYWGSKVSGAKGIGFANVTACASATHGIGLAYVLIQRGMINACICGGSEAPITIDGVSGFAMMRALSVNFNDRPEEASRPFTSDRDGFIIAEGAGVLILETLENALERGADIYAEIIGFGASSDADDWVAPLEDGSGIAQAMKQAIGPVMANIEPEEIDYINSHGTSTPTGDDREVKGIIKALGKNVSEKVYVNSTKSMLGHSLGASGALEAIVCIEALRSKKIHPTKNLTEKNIDPECLGIRHVTEAITIPDLNIDMSNSLGFGGQNASLIFKSWEEK